jgi:hypothetical protein
MGDDDEMLMPSDDNVAGRTLRQRYRSGPRPSNTSNVTSAHQRKWFCVKRVRSVPRPSSSQ